MSGVRASLGARVGTGAPRAGPLHGPSPHPTGEIMGFFTKDAAGLPQAGPAPLSRDRITSVLDARGLNYGIDDDGDVGGYWDGHLFFFFVIGPSQEYLQVKGRWNRSVGIEELGALQGLVNDWNAQRLWPKGYAVAEGDVVGVYAEHAVDYEHGVTDEQLDLHLQCAISTSLALFESLDESYPQAAAVARAEHEAAAQARQEDS